MSTVIPINEAQFSVSELCEITSAQLALRGFETCTSVITDTRSLTPGALFVALIGERFDAHSFLAIAIEAKAHVLLVNACPQVDEIISRLERGAFDSTPSVLVVADTLVALGQLAQFHRRRHQVALVAVAGSAGKTTTRSVLSSLFEQVAPGQVHSTRGNLNNRIGVPMTLLGLRPAHRYAVVELGTNCPGEIAILSEMAEPDVAILTLIDLEHTEGLGDLDGIEQEEASIFSYIREGGAAIGNGGDARVKKCVLASGAAHCLLYSEESSADLQIVSRQLLAPNRIELALRRSDGSQLRFSSGLVGKAGALAAAAAVLAVEFMTQAQLSDTQCEAALRDAGEPGRHALIALNGDRWIVDDSYNSNPASVAISIQAGAEIAEKNGGQLWLVLGEMLELGALSESEHRKLGELAGCSSARGIYFIQGDAELSHQFCQQFTKKSEFYPDAEQVANNLAPLLQARDVVVVKASRGVRAERVVEGLTAFFGRSESAQFDSDHPSSSQPHT